MSTITSLKLGTVPITEEGVERYKFSDTITNHFTQILEFTEDLNCSVGRIFSKMKVPVSWFTVMNANYMIATMDINNPSGSTLNIKAWIDAIDLLSDSEDHPMVEIRWHFDYFEMFKSSVTLGYGHIKRRPYYSLATTPYQDYPMIYRKKGTHVYDICPPKYLKGNVDPDERLKYIIFSYNTLSGNEVVRTSYGCIPICKTNFRLYDSDGDTVFAVQAYEFDGNVLSSWFNIRPSTVNGIWVADYPPFPTTSITWTGTHLRCTAGNWGLKKANVGGIYYGFWYTDSTPISYTPETVDLLSNLVSTEEESLSILGQDGEIVFSLPYGMEFRYALIRTVLQTDSAVFEAIFYPSGGDSSRDAGSIGLKAIIPWMPVPLMSNAWSEYAYSEQRSYDMEMRQLQTDAGAVKQIAAGAGQGMMMGAFGSRGLIVGGLGGTIGGLTNYLTETYWQNDKEQELLDRLKANQSNSILKSGYLTTDILYNGSITKLQSFVKDSYSSTQLSNTRSNFGISVDEILSSCNTQVKTTAPTGYYVIKNLIISGSAPKEAKDYIKKKFDAGVRLL